MTIQALFALSIIMSFVASGIVAWLFLWPWLRGKPRDDALVPLLVPHAFRFIGLSFLVPGVVSPTRKSSCLSRPAQSGEAGGTELFRQALVRLP